MIQCAHAGSKKKGSYFKARYKRIALRRGKKKAIVAVAHKILMGAYYVLKHEVAYKDAGENYFDQLHRQSTINYHLSRLRQLGICLPKAQLLQVETVPASLS